MCLLLSIILLISLFWINKQLLEEQEYTNNLLISSIIEEVKQNYPEVDELEIIKILNNPDLKESDTLKQYGIDIKNDAISVQEKQIKDKILKRNACILFLYIISIFCILLFFHQKEKKKIMEITHYIKEINNQHYALDILKNSEDDLSILKNEIYKTAVTLNEQAHLLKAEKDALKESLSDISHQLKTPLTSITLMIDTLKENEQLSKEEKRELLTNIHRKISNTNFLVHSLLKLSKFDANAIEFNDEYNKIKDILEEVKDNLSILSDLKDIKINIEGNQEDQIYCDYKWQVEALTNIVKNGIEHAGNSKKIDIKYETNELFTKITIKDYGIGMSKDEIHHIFERFYKGKNASPDSIGIGLALAKSIIEKDNGYITVESKLEKGSTFIIKYIK